MQDVCRQKASVCIDRGNNRSPERAGRKQRGQKNRGSRDKTDEGGTLDKKTSASVHSSGREASWMAAAAPGALWVADRQIKEHGRFHVRFP